MTLTRRKTLAILGGGTIVAATGAGAALMTPPSKALAPWKDAGTYAEPRMRALSYAILAPNPHNRQPWIVDLSTDGQAGLYVDTDRLLPHTDPFSRQIVVGLGCFLEILRLAAAEDGYDVQIDLFPDGFDAEALDARPVAICRFEPGGVPEPTLFGEVLKRRSLKEPYDTTREVSVDALVSLASVVISGSRSGYTNDPDDVAAIRELTADAFRIEFETDRTYRESVDLFRIGRREVNANPDGLDFSGPMFEALHLTGLFTREGSLDRNGFSYSQALEMITANAMTGMAYIWINSETNTRVDQIRAGQDWVRLNLAATALGIGVQPMSQALQEFPEMDPLYRDIHDRLAPEGGTVQMLGRLGYGPEVPVSPRWGVEDKIRNG